MAAYFWPGGNGADKAAVRRRRLILGPALLTCLGLTCIPPDPSAPLTLDEPTDMQVVIGGIADTRPYFGKLKTQEGLEEGDFLLATCGCGDWRVLISPTGKPQTQVPVRFFAPGPYSTSGPVTFYGIESGNRTRGTVDQDGGLASGLIEVPDALHGYSGERGEAHAQSIQACVMCHIGEKPIWPQPAGHPVYVPGQTDCFACHTVVIE
jgi:hypothetical protein